MESLMRQTSVDGSLSGSDEQIEAMMQEHFGPKLSGRQETAHERTARGLRQLEDLHSIEGAPPIRWSHQCLNHAPARRIAPPLCFACGAEGAKSACAKCVVARYCTRECQVADWKARHKQGCAAFKTLGVAQKFADAVSAGSATDALVGKMRLYAFPFAIQSLRTAGRGFVFLQSDTSLDVLSLPTGSPPIDCAGRPLVQARCVLMHYVTLEEFDTEISQALPALLPARRALVEAIDKYDDTGEAVLLVHFGPSPDNSFTGVAIAPLAPDVAVCRAMGAEYAGKDALQIDLDDLGM